MDARRHWILAVTYVLLSAQVLLVFLVRPGIEGHLSAVFQDWIYGRAHKPYCYRVLVPGTVRLITEATPERIRDAVRARTVDMKRLHAFRWNLDYAYEYLVTIVILFGCFVAFAYVMRGLARSFYDYPPLVADLTPVVSFILLPVFFRYFSYLYDPATLLLYGVATLAVYRRKLLLLYVIMVLATFNKETSIVLVAWFVAREYRERPRRRMVLHAALLTVLYAALRVGIGVVYRDNPGPVVEFHLFDHNLQLLRRPLALVWFLMLITGSMLLLREGWREKRPYLRRILLVTVIPLVAGGVFFGYVDELRGYYEAFPAFVLLILPTLVRIFRPNHSRVA